MKNLLHAGSRGSALALWQTNWVVDCLQKIHPHLKIQTQIIHTTGDKILDSPLSQIGEKGLFTKELDKALLDGKIDFAVHSLKDLPTTIPEGLCICAITQREECRDALISKEKKSLRELPPSAVIATGSLRRKAQLLVFSPSFEIVDIRGNVDSRLKKFEQSSWDAMILACAGLKRLGLLDRVSQVIPIEDMIPAPGQGSLGIVCREKDLDAREILKTLNHTPSSIAVRSERSFLKALEGGCQVPLGAFAKIQGDKIYLDGFVGDINGQKYLKKQISGDLNSPENLGIKLAGEFLSKGAGEILKEIQHGRKS